MSVNPTFKDRLASRILPALMLFSAIRHFLQVTFETVFLRRDPLGLFYPYKIRDEAFSRFWLDLTNEQPPEDISKLEGAAKLIPPILSLATGDVLDIGPGSGSTLRYMPKPSSSGVKKFYGAEPSVGLHVKLREHADRAGLGSDYVILPCAAEEKVLAEALAEAGIIDEPTNKRGLFDTIICVRVLCSIPEPLQAAENFYRLLKPGGSLLVVEHVVNPWKTAKGSIVARALQVFYMVVGRWRFFIGECCMDRDSETMLRKIAVADGGWESVEIDRHFEWSPLCHISGRLVKKG